MSQSTAVEDLEKEEAKIRNIKDQQNLGLVDLREEDNYVMREFCTMTVGVRSVSHEWYERLLRHAVVGEERYRLQPRALEDPVVQELTEVCIRVRVCVRASVCVGMSD